MTLDEAVDRVVGHMQRRAGASRGLVREALEAIEKAGVLSFEPDLQPHTLTVPVLEVQDRTKARISLDVAIAALRGAGFSVSRL